MPGGVLRLFTGHFSVKHLSPLRNKATPSRRHSRHFGPRYLATNFSLNELPAARSAIMQVRSANLNLYAPTLAWAAAVMRHRCHVTNRTDFQTGRLQGTI